MDYMVSVIIPTFNRANSIMDALESIEKQTYKDIETIVVDDGSSDNTRGIINKHFPSVRYFYQENSGPASARNTGIKKAQGSFIAFLDSDDCWDADKIKKQIEMFKEHPDVGFVFCKIAHINDVGEIYWTDRFSNDFNGYIAEKILFNSIAPTSVMIKKESVDRCGVFDPNLWSSEDVDLFLRITKQYKAAFVPEVLVFRRYLGDNITRNNSKIESMKDDHLYVLSKHTKDFDRRTIRRAYSKVYMDYSLKYKMAGNYKLFLVNFMKSIGFGLFWIETYRTVYYALLRKK